MGYVNNEIRNNTSTVSANLCMRLRKYRKMDKNSWNKFGKITTCPTSSILPHPTNNVKRKRLYPKFFPNFTFYKLVGEGEL